MVVTAAATAAIGLLQAAATRAVLVVAAATRVVLVAAAATRAAAIRPGMVVVATALVVGADVVVAAAVVTLLLVVAVARSSHGWGTSRPLGCLSRRRVRPRSLPTPPAFSTLAPALPPMSTR